jgi:hypothetical protein
MVTDHRLVWVRLPKHHFGKLLSALLDYERIKGKWQPFYFYTDSISLVRSDGFSSGISFIVKNEKERMGLGMGTLWTMFFLNLSFI